MANWWPASAVAAYAPVGMASLAASYADLSGNGNPAAPVGGSAPTFDTEIGWTFNGTSQLLECPAPPQNDQGWSMFIRYSGFSGAGVRFLCGVSGNGSDDFGPYFNIGPAWPIDTPPPILFSSGGNIFEGVAPAAGVLGIAGNRAYVDGVATPSTIPASGSGAFGTVYIGARHSGGLYALPVNVQAFVLCNADLDATEAATLTAAMAALPVAAGAAPIIAAQHAALTEGGVWI